MPVSSLQSPSLSAGVLQTRIFHFFCPMWTVAVRLAMLASAVNRDGGQAHPGGGVAAASALAASIARRTSVVADAAAIAPRITPRFSACSTR